MMDMPIWALFAWLFAAIMLLAAFVMFACALVSWLHGRARYEAWLDRQESKNR